MPFTYKEAKSLIEAAGWMIDNGLMRFLVEANGYETTEHARLRFNTGMRKDDHRWQSIPDFSDFDEARRFLLDDNTRIILLQQNQPNHPRKWRCQLQRSGDGSLYEGSGYGSQPGHALSAAWVGLQIERNRR